MNKFKGLLSNIIVYALIIFGIMFILEKSCDAINKYVDEKTNIYKNDDSVFYQEFGYNPSDTKMYLFTIHDITGSKFDVMIYYIDADNSVDKDSLEAYITNLSKTVDIENLTCDEYNNIINSIRSVCALTKIEFKTI